MCCCSDEPVEETARRLVQNLSEYFPSRAAPTAIMTLPITIHRVLPSVSWTNGNQKVLFLGDSSITALYRWPRVASAMARGSVKAFPSSPPPPPPFLSSGSESE
jgi:hypothetical protein